MPDSFQFLRLAHEGQEVGSAFALWRYANSDAGLHRLHRINPATQSCEIRQEDMRRPVYNGDGSRDLGRCFNLNPLTGCQVLQESGLRIGAGVFEVAF